MTLKNTAKYENKNISANKPISLKSREFLRAESNDFLNPFRSEKKNSIICQFLVQLEGNFSKKCQTY